MIGNPLSIPNNQIDSSTFIYIYISNYTNDINVLDIYYERVLPTLKYWNFIHSLCIIKFKHKFVKYYTTTIISLYLVIQLIKRKIYII